MILAASNPSHNAVSSTADDDGEFADFASFQATTLPQSTTDLVPKTETDREMNSLAGYQPASMSSLSFSDNSSSATVSSKGASDKYRMIKELISNPALFTSPAGAPNEDMNSDWSDFQAPPTADVVHSGVPDISDADFRPSSSPSDGEWADFQSTSAVGVSQSSQAVHIIFHDPPPPSSLPHIEEPPVRTKSSNVADYSSGAGWFGIQQNHPVKPSHALFSSGALDFCPPELPPENDDDDPNDMGFYLGGHGGRGISSLSALDLEDDPVDSVRNGGGFLKAGVHGMATSNSTSSFEFTGWQLGSKHSLPVPAADSQSTSSLDLRPSADPSSSPSQPAAEADSQSESSFDFVAPSETRLASSGILGADSDRMSLQSLELKSTIVSPEEEPSSAIGRDDMMPVNCQSLSGIDSAATSSGMPSIHCFSLCF